MPSLHGEGLYPADFDASRVVDLADFLIFAEAFNTATGDPAFNARVDLDGGGTVDFPDFLLFLDAFGLTSPDVGNDVGNGLEIIHGPDGPEPPDHDNPFKSIAVHPSDANTVLLGTERNGFVRTADGGETWTRHRLGLRHKPEGYPEIYDIAYDTTDPTRVYAATLGSPGPVTGDWPSSSGGVYRSEDGGDTWARANCGLTSSRVASITFVERDGAVIIGVDGGAPTFTELADAFFPGGLFRSTDGGRNWTAVPVEADSANGYGPFRVRGDTLTTYGSVFEDSERNAGFLRSTDGGSTWVPFAADLQALPTINFDLSADGTRIVANARGSFQLRISDAAGLTWRTTEINQAGGPVAISPLDPDHILFASTGFTLTRTTDAAVTHEVVAQAGGHFTDIVFAPSDPTIVYAAAEGSDFFRSTDAGATWTLMANIRNDVLNP